MLGTALRVRSSAWRVPRSETFLPCHLSGRGRGRQRKIVRGARRESGWRSAGHRQAPARSAPARQPGTRPLYRGGGRVAFLVTPHPSKKNRENNTGLTCSTDEIRKPDARTKIFLDFS